MTCCFFGHKDTPSAIAPKLEAILIDLIENHNVDSFLMGNQGSFDAMALSAVRKLKEKYPFISYSVVLAYMPGYNEGNLVYSPEETMYPEGLESVPPRFAISWRNKWMVRESDVVVCYIAHSWGRATQYVDQARKKGCPTINIESQETVFEFCL